ncbi:MAG: glycosyltransferase family 4 protein [Candidatus Saccharimonadales bacterium]
MNIAMMVRGYIPVPRPNDMIYAPIDLAQAIAEGLAAKGHNIDFYAPLGSSVKGVQVVSENLRPLASNQSEFSRLMADADKNAHYFPALWEDYLAEKMFDRAARGEYDVLHFHHPEAALPFVKAHTKVPVVYTLHDPLHEWYKELYSLYDSPNQHFISISNNQRRDAPDLRYLKTIYNGISLEDYPFSDKPEDYLLYAGRIVPEKGVREAIQVARRTNHRLLIIGPVYSDGQGYFDQYIKPYLSDKILYLGYLDRTQLPAYYQKAKAVLTPVQWEEPFGLTTIEAMASGTPVISFRRGAAPEIIKDGRTGFIVDTSAEMIEAIKNIKKIDRKACRDHIKRHFSTTKMVSNYEAAFEEVMSEQKITPTLVGRRLRRVPKLIREASQKQRLQKIIKKTTKPKSKNL